MAMMPSGRLHSLHACYNMRITMENHVGRVERYQRIFLRPGQLSASACIVTLCFHLFLGHNNRSHHDPAGDDHMCSSLLL